MKSTKSLQLTSTEELTNFLKRFSPVSSNLLLEVEDGYLKAKTHTPERSVVKSSKIPIGRMFSNDDAFDEDVKFGLFSVERMMKAFSHFGNSAINFELHQESTSDGNVGTDINLKNESLDINFQCASLRLFTYITDEMMDKIADSSSSEISFVLTKEIQSKINSLAGIDSDQKLLTLGVKKGNVIVSGKSFNLNIGQIENKSADISVSVYKNQFAFLDKEDTMVYLSEDRLIFHSIESDTKMIIGKAE
ncbi:MAG: hypothetical protein RLZZ479_414 [Bacteroidota bacterium]|jgi:hypothetical protein